MAQNKPISIDLGQGISLMIGLATISSWKNESRPKKAKAGTLGFNTQTNSLEYWNGTVWFTVQMKEI